MRGLLSYKQPTTEVERTTLRIKADGSGDIYLPIGGMNLSGSVGAPYNWDVSIDGGDITNYNGTGSSGGVIKVGFGLKPGTTHTVTIKPHVIEYGWCRALSYMNVNATYKASLINIISDKSYMGYAKSATETGNYFKYWQYGGCINLLDTDNEVLPDSVHYLGNNYRAYEYSGCTSLKGNAQEKVFKQVRKIGTYYRANQYQNCSGMTTVRMRAINWCSTGYGFRNNMLSGVGSSSNKATLIIEGGIVEGGDWGLTDANVNQVLVYKGLVADYKTKLSGITASKIVNNPDWDTNNYEYLEFSINADANGDIKIPVAGLSTTGSQNCAYDWLVSVDGSATTEYTGTGSATAITVGSGTAGSSHRILIYPKTEDWGWGRAFGFYNSGIASLLTEFIHDSFKCYADSYTDTGDYFRAYTFDGCVNLTNCYEKLPTSCDTVGDYFHFHDYDGCTSLETATWEVMHNISSMGESFRAYAFYNCSGLKLHLGIYAKPGSISVYPTDYRKEMFGNAGNGLVVNMWGYEALATGLTNAMGLVNNNVSTINCTFEDILSYQDNANWSNIAVSKYHATVYPYTPGPTLELDAGLQLEWTKTLTYDGVLAFDSDGYGRQWCSIHNVGIGVSDDEKYVYMQGTYDYYNGYYHRAIMFQKMEDVGVVHLSRDTRSSWLITSGSPWGTSHDAEPKGITFYTSSNKWFAGWDWGDYTYWGRGLVHGYNMSGYTPTYNVNYGWQPFFYPDSNNSLDRFLGADRFGYNALANERGITVFNYRDTGDVSLGSEIGSHVEFADDGLTCYILNGRTITEYRMSKYLNFSTKTSTGKTFVIPEGCGGFTIKGGHLYCNNGTTIYKYSVPSE